MHLKELPFLMSVAELSAERSKAIRLKVGAVAADSEGRIIATGFNGTHVGAENTCESKIYADSDIDEFDNTEYPYYDVTTRNHYKLVTLDSVIHAEQNVIAYSARRGLSLEGASVIGTHSPCMKCATLLIQSGVKEMWFKHKYRQFDEVNDEVGQYIRLNHYCG